MTIPSEINRSGPYFGNGATKLFDYDFKIVDASHIQVIRAEDGVETILELDVDYTVHGVGNDNGGQIETTEAPTDEQSITNLLDVPFTQEIDLENQGAYYAETVEAGLDLAVLRDQQLSERISRAVVIPPSADPSELETLVGSVLRLSSSADNIDTVANIADEVANVSDNMAGVLAAAGAASAAHASQVAAAASASAAAADRVQTGLDRTAAAMAANAALESADNAEAERVDAQTARVGAEAALGNMEGILAGEGLLLSTNNLSDVEDPAAARDNLGLGSAATLDAGAAPLNVVQLDESGKLPALDGSQLTGLSVRAPQTMICTADSTYTRSPGCKSIDVVLIGGGGGGGGVSGAASQAAIGGPGSAAGVCIKHYEFSPAAITAATKANPCVLAIANNPFFNGDVIEINGVVGMVELNGNTYTVAGRTATTVQLQSVNSTGFGTYSSGGEAEFVSCPVQIGEGGSPGTTAPTKGGDAEASIFRSLIAGGGLGGYEMSAGTTFLGASYDRGGLASGGDLNLPGAPGSRNIRLNGTQLLPTAAGGSSPFGGGGIQLSSGDGQPGTGYGSGGSAGATTTATARNGGTGAPGIGLITENFF